MRWLLRVKSFGGVALCAAVASLTASCASAPKCAEAPQAPAAATNPPPPLHEHAEPGGAEHEHLAHEHADHEHDQAGDAAEPTNEHGIVVQHKDLKHFENNGNDLVGIATPSLGSKEHEVWRSTIAVGSKTPLHRHESEEIFVFLRGQGRAEIGGHSLEFAAPVTVIAPAGVPHQFFNTGAEPTDAIVIVGRHSTIWDAQGKAMQLPWRR